MGIRRIFALGNKCTGILVLTLDVLGDKSRCGRYNLHRNTFIPVQLSLIASFKTEPGWGCNNSRRSALTVPNISELMQRRPLREQPSFML